MVKTALRLINTAHLGEPMPGNEPARIDVCEIGHDFRYWSGESGRRYLHSVYPLLECPEFPKANYIIVRRLTNGECLPLCIGQTNEDACSLNLARIRHEAALLGGTEIHIHVMTESTDERDEVEPDLLMGQFKLLEDRLRRQAANLAEFEDALA
jgi:hypothetical protein